MNQNELILPSPSELERLAILAEECAEVQQIVMKIIRHGYESYNPFDEGRTTNRELLHKELGDLQCAVLMMSNADDINRQVIANMADRKKESIKKYLHYQ